MAQVIEFPRRNKAEVVVMRAVAVVRAAMPSDSCINHDGLLDLLLEVLDGPEALEIYNRVMQTYLGDESDPLPTRAVCSR